MLITCPECKKQISDKSEICIHCGYPFKKINVCNINGVEYDFSDILLNISNNQNTPAICIRKISDMCNIPIYEAKEIYFKIINDNELPQNITCEDKIQPNIPKCPTCGSTKLSNVSTLSKAGSVFMFGLLSQKVKKTWHCNNCGYEW